MRAERKYFIFLLLWMIPFFVYSQRCDSIEWSKYHALKWRDFKGIPKKNSGADALSESHISYELLITHTLATLRVSCHFSTCHSWVKNKRSRNLLKHEQTHFDLAEYHKRLLVKEILNQKFSYQDVVVRVKTINDQVNRLRKQADELYDQQTAHSINEREQKKWTRRVHRMVRKLKGYDQSSYSIHLN